MADQQEALERLRELYMVQLHTQPEDDRTLREGTVDFVSFSYYSSRCITVDKELMAAENAEGNAVSASVKNPYRIDT